MKSSLLIVVAASAATILLLAVPKKGASVGTSAAAETPFIPKVKAAASPEADERSKRLAAQLLRLPTLEWKRDPFSPIELTPDPLLVDSETPIDPPPAEEPTLEPVEPDPIPEAPMPLPRTGPLPILSGISHSGAHRFAIVNRLIVEEGDPLPTGDVVMSIGHRTVTLRKDEEIFVIRLGDGR